MQKILLDPFVKIIYMETKDQLRDKHAYLPDGQLVVIEEVHSDGFATARRIDGEWNGRIAVCAVNKLRPFTQPDDNAGRHQNNSG